jgi:hypothetical protein
VFDVPPVVNLQLILPSKKENKLKSLRNRTKKQTI